MMKISVFFSHPTPYCPKQEKFIDGFEKYLRKCDLEPRTLGVTDYDPATPLDTIRGMMMETCGIVTLALKRMHIETGEYHSKGAEGANSVKIEKTNDIWLTSPYCQIETAMAYEMGLPLLLFREKGVREEGVFEKGVISMFIPEFDSDDGQPVDKYVKQPEWMQIIQKWQRDVHWYRDQRIKRRTSFWPEWM